VTFRKDRSLDQLARVGNVAQFVSFAPQNGKPLQEFSRVAGYGANHLFQNIAEALTALLAASPERTINIRSFEPESPHSHEFHYGVGNYEQALVLIERPVATECLLLPMKPSM
jgi:hypothetical protein